MRVFRSFLVLLIFGLTVLSATLAQEGTVVVPDVVGLNVPQAAATLNDVGLRLGTQTVELWTADSDQPQDSVRAQSVAAGSAVAPGTTVDITVLRSPNVEIIYDDNDLTLVNHSGVNLNFSRIAFVTPNSAVAFSPTRWRDQLPDGDCAQIWSISRGEPKHIPECAYSIYWLTTNNTAEHFWTQVNGVTQFSMQLDGSELITCAAASAGSQDNPSRCGFFWPESVGHDVVAPFIYLAYTPEALAVINITTDQWLPIRQTAFVNQAGTAWTLGSEGLLAGQETIGNIDQLAPGQCVLLTAGSPDAVPPDDCSVIARREVTANDAFWLTDFVVQSVADAVQRGCPAAAAGKLSICVMPR